jgi:hypothetical protein
MKNPLTMLQEYGQAVDFKVGHHFGEEQESVGACMRVPTTVKSNGVFPQSATRDHEELLTSPAP